MPAGRHKSVALHPQQRVEGPALRKSWDSNALLLHQSLWRLVWHEVRRVAQRPVGTSPLERRHAIRVAPSSSTARTTVRVRTTVRLSVGAS